MIGRTDCIGWRSEVGADRAGDTIVVVDREQDAPLVEGRARMRDAAADKIAHLRRAASSSAAKRKYAC